MKEYELRVGDYLSRDSSDVRLIYGGMNNPYTFCLISSRSGHLYFPRDTDKIGFFPDGSDNKVGILKVSDVTPKKIILLETVEDSNPNHRISQYKGELWLPNMEK